MDIKIMPGPLRGVVKAIPSKSQAHRALICAALADKPTIIECDSESGDISATVACMSALGAEIRRDQGGYRVNPLRRIDVEGVVSPPCGESVGAAGISLQCGESQNTIETSLQYGESGSAAGVSLPCGESGSTFRFLLPVVGALGRKVSFQLEGRLSQRPLSPLYEELVKHGCKLSPKGTVPFCIEGQLTPGNYRLDAGVSSQFISGLLFSLPLLGGESKLSLSGQIESFSYIGLTLAMLEKYGIIIEYKDMAFSIPGGQTYRSPGTVHVEGDWSNAAFWLCTGAIGGDNVSVTGLDLQSRQGDRAVLDILSRFGAHVEQSDSAAIVSGGDLRGIEIDARDIPDLVPILAVVGSAASGVTIIRHAERLRGKESDRLAAVTSVLCGLGAEIQEGKDSLQIYGGKTLKGGTVASWGDHRIAMAAAIAATMCAEPVVIRGAEAVNKSYPGFFEDLQLLGGHSQTVN